MISPLVVCTPLPMLEETFGTLYRPALYGTLVMNLIEDPYHFVRFGKARGKVVTVHPGHYLTLR
jgi:hypothetical protein